MKIFLKISLFILLSLGISFSADAQKKRVKSKSTKSRVTAPAVVKGEEKKYGDFLTTQIYSIKKGDSKISIEYPVSGNPELVSEMRRFIVSGVLEDQSANPDTYLNNPEALLVKAIKPYSRKCEIFKNCELIDLDVKVKYNNGKIITLLNSRDWYGGGVHGSYSLIGATFLTSNGKVYDSSFFPPFNSVRGIFVSDLQDKTDGELDSLEYPETGAYIDENGVNFQYQQYEIGSYAAGLPCVTVPISKIKSLSSSNAYPFFE